MPNREKPAAIQNRALPHEKIRQTGRKKKKAEPFNLRKTIACFQPACRGKGHGIAPVPSRLTEAAGKGKPATASTSAPAIESPAKPPIPQGQRLSGWLIRPAPLFGIAFGIALPLADRAGFLSFSGNEPALPVPALTSCRLFVS